MPPEDAVARARRKVFEAELARQPKPISDLELEKQNSCVWTGRWQYVILPAEDDEDTAED